MRFQVLTVASLKFRVFWDVAPCSHIEVGRRFRGAYYLYHQGDDEAVRTFETSANFNVTTRRYIPEDSKLLALSWTDKDQSEILMSTLISTYLYQI
jgi:hypothetical protein